MTFSSLYEIISDLHDSYHVGLINVLLISADLVLRFRSQVILGLVTSFDVFLIPGEHIVSRSIKPVNQFKINMQN